MSWVEFMRCVNIFSSIDTIVVIQSNCWASGKAFVVEFDIQWHAPADVVEGAVIILQAAPLPFSTEWVWPALAQSCACLVHNPGAPPG